jgi:hypothetical protein
MRDSSNLNVLDKKTRGKQRETERKSTRIRGKPKENQREIKGNPTETQRKKKIMPYQEKPITNEKK